jgi:hypothetical protein
MRNSTPPEIKAAAAKIARDVLAPHIEIFDFKQERERKALLNRSRHAHAIGSLFTIQHSIRGETSANSIEKRHLCDLAINFLRITCDHEVLDRMGTLVESLDDREMPREVRDYTSAFLKSLKGALYKVSGRGRGHPPGKGYDALIAEAAACMDAIEGFDIPLTRNAGDRRSSDDAGSDKASRCSIIRDVLADLGIDMTESAVTESCLRGRKETLLSRRLILEAIQILRTNHNHLVRA